MKRIDIIANKIKNYCDDISADVVLIYPLSIGYKAIISQQENRIEKEYSSIDEAVSDIGIIAGSKTTIIIDDI